MPTYLAKVHLAGAFNVTVEITDAAEVAIPIEDKPGARRLETRLAPKPKSAAKAAPAAPR